MSGEYYWMGDTEDEVCHRVESNHEPAHKAIGPTRGQ